MQRYPKSFFLDSVDVEHSIVKRYSRQIWRRVGHVTPGSDLLITGNIAARELYE